jgi:N-acetylglucosaminyldiphosphoundecaprenol N-acetyl-beta-D-mannosaminyltransferase
MIDLGKKNVLGVYVDAVDYDAAVERVIAAAKASQSLAATALAVHGIMTGALDPVQCYRLNQMDLVTPDGQPVRWALAWLYRTRLPDRVYGPTLMLRICERASQERLPIFLFGSQPGVISALQKNLQTRFPQLNIAGIEPSRFRRISEEEKQETIHKIQFSGARLMFVGLGCPRQEVWIFENRQYLSMPLIGVGAAFDFHAGKQPQAPPYLQSRGLEWLYRLWNDPKRLWKRYILLNPLYLCYLFLQKTAVRRFDPQEVELPTDYLYFG